MSPQYQLAPVHDREQWDSFISSHPDGHLLQSWGWGELKTETGWRSLRLALMDTGQGRIIAAAQALLRSPSRLPHRLGSMAYIPKGPTLSWPCATPDEHDADRVFFAQLLPALRQQGVIAVQIELPQVITTGTSSQNEASPEANEASNATSHLVALGFRPARHVQPLRSILLDLTPTEDALLTAMKEKWRYNIRLSARKGVEVRTARSLEDVQAWYHLLQVTGQRDDFGIHTFDYYRHAWQLFVPRNQAQLFLAEYDGQLLAGIFVGCMARQAMYLYGASSNEQRQLMPNHLLQWEAIRWAKSQGARTYDFWGIPDTEDPDESLAGVYRFKSGWGGQVVRFAGNFEYVCRPMMMRLASRFTQK